jgi:hypothetical protein
MTSLTYARFGVRPQAWGKSIMRNRHLINLLIVIVIASVVSAVCAQSLPVEINTKLHKHFRFVAYGDTRFTDPKNTKDANPEVRQQIVQGIAVLTLTSSLSVVISLSMATTLVIGMSMTRRLQFGGSVEYLSIRRLATMICTAISISRWETISAAFPYSSKIDFTLSARPEP